MNTWTGNNCYGHLIARVTYNFFPLILKTNKDLKKCSIIQSAKLYYAIDKGRTIYTKWVLFLNHVFTKLEKKWQLVLKLIMEMGMCQGVNNPTK